jgi:hypothetical protein
MILGTHNSATGGELLWWLKPFAWVINPTSKCQDRTIAQQLADGVRLFNLQVAYIGGKWRFSHGLAVYKEDVWEALKLMKLCASVKEPIYFQLYLDKCAWCKQDVEEFEFLVAQIRKEYCNNFFILERTWIEGVEAWKRGNTLSLEEHYWTLSWAKANAKSWIDYLPLPKRHAKKYNATYKGECKSKYLMLDYYELG